MKSIKSITSAVLIAVLLLTSTSPALAVVNHTVTPGESLYELSLKYGSPIEKIKKDNGLRSNTIYPGQSLTIDTPVYVVRKGDTLQKIAQKHGVSLVALVKENGLKGSKILPGQELRIPQGNIAPSRSTGQNYSAEDLHLLARAVYGEARGESYTGQVAVAAVILNRVENKNFPNSIKGVIYEPLAFTAVADGQINLKPNATALRAAREALEGKDPSGGALYYWNPAKATSKWIWSRPIMKRIGNHVFAK